MTTIKKSDRELGMCQDISRRDFIHDAGLAAAHFYQAKFGKNTRILILENHDDFGGHAKRNEFHQGGQMRLSLGGTHNLEYWKFSDTVDAMMDELGIDIGKMLRNKEFDYGGNGRNGPALWFDADTYGQDKLLTGCSFQESDSERMLACVDEFPVSETARDQLKHFYSMRTNVLEGKNEEQVWAYLEGTAYTDFLRRHGGLGDEAVHLFDNANHGGWGVETRSLSIAECVEVGLPGLHLLGKSSIVDAVEYPVAFFPDGNASLARLLVHTLIPAVAPGTNADNIALAKFDYKQLDRPGNPVRLRLNSTVVNATNIDSGVDSGVTLH